MKSSLQAASGLLVVATSISLCLVPAFAQDALGQKPGDRTCRLGKTSYNEDNLIRFLSDPAGTPEQRQFTLMILQKCLDSGQ
jgi:hypothetical protein